VGIRTGGGKKVPGQVVLGRSPPSTRDYRFF
jgi:hypothetical protein